MNRNIRDAHHKYSINFLKKCETSKQKWNFINKKLGNHKQGINVSEIEIDGAMTIDKKTQSAMHLKNLLRKWANILVISFLSISINWTTVLKNSILEY